MKRVVLLCLLLVACGTPQEQCIARGTRDLRVVERLIAESEATLARGYALEDVTLYRTVWEPCAPLRPPRPPVNGKPPEPAHPRMCLEREPYTVERPKAVDLDAEARKLKQLKQKRQDLLRAAEDVIAQCRAAYPE